ncbi:MAG: hypothetical protein ACUVSX_08820 [Aggregatilineales bacterium]
MMNDDPPDSPASLSPDELAALRSPLRPAPPPETPPAPAAPRDPTQLDPAPAPADPVAALAALLRKMEQAARQYASGAINRAQFNAIYGHYKEQRAIIERLLERDPEGSAWRQAAAAGHTGFLLSHFAARPLYYAIYTLQPPRPLMTGGRQSPDLNLFEPILRALVSANRPRAGVARKRLAGGRWLVLALGEHAVTLVVFTLEPAAAQIARVRDLHAEFERANSDALTRGTRTLERMVFPQRALVE